MNQPNNKSRSNQTRPHEMADSSRLPGKEAEEDLIVESMLETFVRSEHDEEEFADLVLQCILGDDEPAPDSADRLPQESGKSSLPVLPPVYEHADSFNGNNVDDNAEIPMGVIDASSSQNYFSFRNIAIASGAIIAFAAGVMLILFFQPVEPPENHANQFGQSSNELNSSENNQPLPNDSGAASTGLVENTDSNPSVNELLADNEQGNIDEGNAVVPDVPSSEQASIEKSQVAENQTDNSLVEENKNANKLVSNQAPKDTEPDWRFKVDLWRSGHGTLYVNSKKLPYRVYSQSALDMLSMIQHEFGRRLRFISPRLDQPVRGELVFSKKTYKFESPDEFEKAFARFWTDIEAFAIKNRFSAIPTRKKTVTIDPIDILDSNRGPLFSLKQRAKKSLSSFSRSSSTIDERENLLTAVKETEKVFLELCVEQGTPAQINTVSDKRPKAGVLSSGIDWRIHERPISDAEFHQFVTTGLIVIPDFKGEFLAKTTFQALSQEQLTHEVYSTAPEFGIFRDLKEFESAREYVVDKAKKMNTGEVKEVYDDMGLIRSRILRIQNGNSKTRDERVKELQDELDIVSARYDELVRVPIEPLAEILPTRPDLRGLPLVMGEECKLSTEEAETLDAVSKSAGATMGRFDFFASRDSANNSTTRYLTLKKQIEKCCELENSEQALKTLDQILQIDHPKLRLDIISALKDSNSEAAHELLIRRAKYDFSPEVRFAAIEALRKYNPADIRQSLLEGFRYPWPVVVKHSAEALVRLNDKGAVPGLVELLNQNDPRLPMREDGVLVKKELVSINHMKNCLLCHAPSRTTRDLGRGRSPDWEQPLPRMYYQDSRGAFVRADITYLQQDFSVTQKVADHGPWPEFQRFDYVVRTKPVNQSDAILADRMTTVYNDEYRHTIGKALRFLTGKSPKEDTYQAWRQALAKWKQ